MAAILLARRFTTNIFKASIKGHSSYSDSAARFSRACFSTAFQHAQGNSGTSTQSMTNDPARQGMYEAKQEALDPDEYARTGASQFMAETAKEGLRKATEVADTVGDAAKKAMDSTWDAAKEANQKIRDDIVENDDDNNNVGDPVIDEVHKLDGPVDTAEYRSLEDLKVTPEDREE